MRLQVLVVAVTLLLLTAHHATSAGGSYTDDARFNMLEVSDLRQILHEKTNGRLDLSQFRTRDQLISAIVKQERVESDVSELRWKAKASLHHRPSSTVIHLRFLICIGCGYQKYYDALKQDLDRALPASQFEFSVDLFPIPMWRSVLSSVCLSGFVGTIAVHFFGPARLGFLPRPLRSLFQQHGGAVVLLGLLLFMVGNALRQSGAFEVYAEDTLIFSKLASGNVPQLAELHECLLRYISAQQA